MEILRGRRLLASELPKGKCDVTEEVQRLPCMRELSKDKIQCLRCGSCFNKKEVEVQNELFTYYYCSACLTLGCVTSHEQFYYLPSQMVKPLKNALQWNGQLSSRQAIVSKKLRDNVEAKKHTLIHAVTGAGKTEMLFEALAYALEKGWRIGLASPRVDVCLELHPRLQQAFPKKEVTLLYGKAEKPDYYTSFVICTTHQLLRFYHHFDLLIIDEVDAFPFKGNKMLAYGANQALAKGGVYVILTATPSRQLLLAEKTGKIERLVLSKRYHGNPLPEPQLVWSWKWAERLNDGKMPANLYAILQKAMSNQRRILIFMPSVLLAEKLYQLLIKYFKQVRIMVAHSRDPERYDKTMAMREARCDWLITTTILERGVTFRDIDVLVVGANHSVFNTASLVQIAGRVGRHADYPTGNVYFFHDQQTRAIRKARQEIKRMNQLEGVEK
ncbi:helicase-related protein [Vagococcus lutrae]|uniref:DEAD/DEAH box helicase n=1 Tax=Vagococcus lutrae TaxID=81947 RepID=UPI0028908420|nr:DEAD/DEAH box helicase [Vagococcus lutrae]MDT2817761.1 helicase-related protein [Vagococcus lutrae]